MHGRPQSWRAKSSISNLCWRYSFHKMFTLGYNASFHLWDWEKYIICWFYTLEKVEIGVHKMQTKFEGCLNLVLLVKFSLTTSYLLMNAYYVCHKWNFGWDFMLTMYLISYSSFFYMQNIITNPNMVQWFWNIASSGFICLFM